MVKFDSKEELGINKVIIYTSHTNSNPWVGAITNGFNNKLRFAHIIYDRDDLNRP